MLHKITTLFLLISMQSFAQESTAITHKDLYSKDGLIYKASNDSIFSGSIENRRWTNNILLSKEDYKDGFIILVTEYYNKSKKGIPYMKTYFHDGLYFKKKKQDRLDFDGTIDSTIYFDENENKILEEFFSEGKLIHSCEYKDGKKNGKQFCISKNGEELNFIYKNGKKVQ